MKPFYICLFIFSIFNIPSFSQSLQIINNTLAEDGLSPLAVDVYINDVIFSENLNFREATEFLSIPISDTPQIVAITESPSNSADEAFMTIPLGLVAFNENYQIILTGIQNHSSHPIQYTFTNNAKILADNPEEIEFSFFNGAIDAPNLDIDLRLTGTLFNDVEYGERDNYFPLLSQLYYLDIRPTGSSTVTNTFEANTTFVQGLAFTVFTSGYWDTSSFGLFAAFANGIVVPLLETGVARLQFIQAAPIGPIDIYFNGELVFDDYNYLNATPYFFWRSDIPTTIAIAGNNSTSVADAVYFYENNEFEDRENYVLITAGSPVDDSFNLFIDEGETIGSNITQFDAKFFHAWNGAPDFDLTLFDPSTELTSLSFGEFSDGYLGLNPGVNIVDMNKTGEEILDTQFFINLTGGGGLPGVVFSAGIFDENSENPNYTWFLALPNGATLPFIPVTRVQFIQNLAANNTDIIDLYVNNNLSFDNMGFRSATPYVFAATRFDYVVGIAGQDSEGPEQIAFELPALRFKDGLNYVAILNGLPEEGELEWHVYEDAQTSAEEGIDVLFHHGVYDVEEMNLSINDGQSTFEELNYGEFQAYQNIMSTTNSFDFEYDTQSQLYQADWGAYEGLSLNVFASGLVENPDSNAVALWVALPNGITFPLSGLVNVEEDAFAKVNFEVHPNPSTDFVNINYTLNQKSDVQIMMLNNLGQIFFTKHKPAQIAGNYFEKIDVDYLPKGEYFLSVIVNQEISTKKIIVLD